MKRRDDISLDDVRASRPRLRPSGEEWVESERGRRVLERVLASDRSAMAPSLAQQKRSGWLAGPRLAFAAGAVLIVALAVVLTVVVLAHDDGKESRVASTVTSTPAMQLVSTYEAVTGILPMYKDLNSYDSAPPTNGATVLDQAAAMGLIPRESVSGDAASSPITQGDYAILLVKAFGGDLPLGTPPSSVDPGAAAGEAAAIDLLRAAGIILPEDGDFAGAEPLTRPVEEKLIARLQEALGYQPE
jgi:hypothetical protein